MCNHKYSTLVQSMNELGWFSAFQCDMCGDLTKQPVPLEKYDDTTLPNIDLIAFEELFKRRIKSIVEQAEQVAV